MTKPSVLIVDDEEAARYGMQRALQRENCELLEAGNAADALKIIRARKPELVLLDVNLPGQSGLDFLKDLGDEEYRPLVIIITAHGSERTALEAGRSGAYDY